MRIAVIGAGTMGHGIAAVAVLGGFETCLVDTSSDALVRACAGVEGIFASSVERGRVDATEVPHLLARLRTTTELAEGVRRADLIVEAVPEDIEAKVALMGTLDLLASPSAVIASNTSALSITEMAATVRQPSRVAGMHFFNPVHKMRLVEVVQGLETSESTLQTVERAARAMGKESVRVRESPGFVTSRINAMIGNEAFFLLEEGVASAADIDRALKLGLNHPMGPFELVDLVGLDTRLRVLEFLHQSLGEKYRPSPLLVKYVRAGRLGRKVRRGVYEYDEAGNRLP